MSFDAAERLLRRLELEIAKARVRVAGTFIAEVVEDVRPLSPELADRIAARWRELALCEPLANG